MKHFLIFTFFMTFIMSSCDDKSMLSEQNSGISTTHSFSNVNALSSDRILVILNLKLNAWRKVFIIYVY